MARDFEPGAKCPLDGIRVLDLSRLVAGNMVSLALADFGAEVLKIEDPKKGDPLRDWQETGPANPEGVSVFWKVYARNKKSVTLNLRSDRGREIVRELVRGCDLLIESFRVGTLEEMGLGPEDLLHINPTLVVIRVSGWGQTGPYADHPGFGSLVEAMAGYAAKNGFPGQPPMLPNLALADMVAGLWGAYAAMVAIHEVKVNGGAGQIIDLSLLEPLISILGPDALTYRITGEVPAKTGNRTSISAPRNVYRTRDGGWVALSASIQSMTERLFHAMGRPDLVDDPRFRTNLDRRNNVEELDRMIQEYVEKLSLDECVEYFRKMQVTIGPVYDISQIVQDHHIVERGVLVELPDAELGSVPMHDVLPRLSGTPGRLRTPAPGLGEHTDAILARLGIGAAARAQLKKDGVT
ncbi:MAG: CoA transferase [Usitatibacter sp.]